MSSVPTISVFPPANSTSSFNQSSATLGGSLPGHTVPSSESSTTNLFGSSFSTLFTPSTQSFSTSSQQSTLSMMHPAPSINFQPAAIPSNSTHSNTLPNHLSTTNSTFNTQNTLNNTQPSTFLPSPSLFQSSSASSSSLQTSLPSSQVNSSPFHTSTNLSQSMPSFFSSSQSSSALNSSIPSTLFNSSQSAPSSYNSLPSSTTPSLIQQPSPSISPPFSLTKTNPTASTLPSFLSTTSLSSTKQESFIDSSIKNSLTNINQPSNSSYNFTPPETITSFSSQMSSSSSAVTASMQNNSLPPSLPPNSTSPPQTTEVINQSPPPSPTSKPYSTNLILGNSKFETLYLSWIIPWLKQGSAESIRAHKSSTEKKIDTVSTDLDKKPSEKDTSSNNFVDEVDEILKQEIESAEQVDEIFFNKLMEEKESFMRLLKVPPRRPNITLSDLYAHISEYYPGWQKITTDVHLLSIYLNIDQFECMGLTYDAIKSMEVEGAVAWHPRLVVEMLFNEQHYELLCLLELADTLHTYHKVGIETIEPEKCSNSVSIAFFSELIKKGFLMLCLQTFSQLIYQVIYPDQGMSNSLENSSFFRYLTKVSQKHYIDMIFNLADILQILFLRFQLNEREVEGLLQLIPHLVTSQTTFSSHSMSLSAFDFDVHMKNLTTQLSARISLLLMISLHPKIPRWVVSRTSPPLKTIKNYTRPFVSEFNTMSDPIEFENQKSELPKNLEIEDISKFWLRLRKNRPTDPEFWSDATPLGSILHFIISGLYLNDSISLLEDITNKHVVQRILEIYLNNTFTSETTGLITFQFFHEIFNNVFIGENGITSVWATILDQEIKMKRKLGNLGECSPLIEILRGLNLMCRRLPSCCLNYLYLVKNCMDRYSSLWEGGSSQNMSEDLGIVGGSELCMLQVAASTLGVCIDTYSDLFIEVLSICGVLCSYGGTKVAEGVLSHFTVPSVMGLHFPLLFIKLFDQLTSAIRGQYVGLPQQLFTTSVSSTLLPSHSTLPYPAQSSVYPPNFGQSNFGPYGPLYGSTNLGSSSMRSFGPSNLTLPASSNISTLLPLSSVLVPSYTHPIGLLDALQNCIRLATGAMHLRLYIILPPTYPLLQEALECKHTRRRVHFLDALYAILRSDASHNTTSTHIPLYGLKSAALEALANGLVRNATTAFSVLQEIGLNLLPILQKDIDLSLFIDEARLSIAFLTTVVTLLQLMGYRRRFNTTLSPSHWSNLSNGNDAPSSQLAPPTSNPTQKISNYNLSSPDYNTQNYNFTPYYYDPTAYPTNTEYLYNITQYITSQIFHKIFKPNPLTQNPYQLPPTRYWRLALLCFKFFRLILRGPLPPLFIEQIDHAASEAFAQHTADYRPTSYLIKTFLSNDSAHFDTFMTLICQLNAKPISLNDSNTSNTNSTNTTSSTDQSSKRNPSASQPNAATLSSTARDINYLNTMKTNSTSKSSTSSSPFDLHYKQKVTHVGLDIIRILFQRDTLYLYSLQSVFHTYSDLPNIPATPYYNPSPPSNLDDTTDHKLVENYIHYSHVRTVVSEFGNSISEMNYVHEQLKRSSLFIVGKEEPDITTNAETSGLNPSRDNYPAQTSQTTPNLGHNFLSSRQDTSPPKGSTGTQDKVDDSFDKQKGIPFTASDSPSYTSHLISILMVSGDQKASVCKLVVYILRQIYLRDSAHISQLIRESPYLLFTLRESFCDLLTDLSLDDTIEEELIQQAVLEKGQKLTHEAASRQKNWANSSSTEPNDSKKNIYDTILGYTYTLSDEELSDPLNSLYLSNHFLEEPNARQRTMYTRVMQQQYLQDYKHFGNRSTSNPIAMSPSNNLNRPKQGFSSSPTSASFPTTRPPTGGLLLHHKAQFENQNEPFLEPFDPNPIVPNTSFISPHHHNTLASSATFFNEKDSTLLSKQFFETHEKIIYTHEIAEHDNFSDPTNFLTPLSSSTSLPFHHKLEQRWLRVEDSLMEGSDLILWHRLCEKERDELSSLENNFRNDTKNVGRTDTVGGVCGMPLSLLDRLYRWVESAYCQDILWYTYPAPLSSFGYTVSIPSSLHSTGSLATPPHTPADWQMCSFNAVGLRLMVLHLLRSALNECSYTHTHTNTPLPHSLLGFQLSCRPPPYSQSWAGSKLNPTEPVSSGSKVYSHRGGGGTGAFVGGSKSADAIAGKYWPIFVEDGSFSAQRSLLQPILHLAMELQPMSSQFIPLNEDTEDPNYSPSNIYLLQAFGFHALNIIELLVTHTQTQDIILRIIQTLWPTRYKDLNALIRTSWASIPSIHRPLMFSQLSSMLQICNVEMAYIAEKTILTMADEASITYAPPFVEKTAANADISNQDLSANITNPSHSFAPPSNSPIIKTRFIKGHFEKPYMILSHLQKAAHSILQIEPGIVQNMNELLLQHKGHPPTSELNKLSGDENKLTEQSYQSALTLLFTRRHLPPIPLYMPMYNALCFLKHRALYNPYEACSTYHNGPILTSLFNANQHQIEMTYLEICITRLPDTLASFFNILTCPFLSPLLIPSPLLSSAGVWPMTAKEPPVLMTLPNPTPSITLICSSTSLLQLTTLHSDLLMSLLVPAHLSLYETSQIYSLFSLLKTLVQAWWILMHISPPSLTGRNTSWTFPTTLAKKLTSLLVDLPQLLPPSVRTLIYESLTYLFHLPQHTYKRPPDINSDTSSQLLHNNHTHIANRTQAAYDIYSSDTKNSYHMHRTHSSHFPNNLQSSFNMSAPHNTQTPYEPLANYSFPPHHTSLAADQSQTHLHPDNPYHTHTHSFNSVATHVVTTSFTDFKRRTEFLNLLFDDTISQNVEKHADSYEMYDFSSSGFKSTSKASQRTPVNITFEQDKPYNLSKTALSVLKCILDGLIAYSRKSENILGGDLARAIPRSKIYQLIQTHLYINDDDLYLSSYEEHFKHSPNVYISLDNKNFGPTQKRLKATLALSTCSILLSLSFVPVIAVNFIQQPMDQESLLDKFLNTSLLTALTTNTQLSIFQNNLNSLTNQLKQFTLPLPPLRLYLSFLLFLQVLAGPLPRDKLILGGLINWLNKNAELFLCPFRVFDSLYNVIMKTSSNESILGMSDILNEISVEDGKVKTGPSQGSMDLFVHNIWGDYDDSLSYNPPYFTTLLRPSSPPINTILRLANESLRIYVACVIFHTQTRCETQKWSIWSNLISADIHISNDLPNLLSSLTNVLTFQYINPHTFTHNSPYKPYESNVYKSALPYTQFSPPPYTQAHLQNLITHFSSLTHRFLTSSYNMPSIPPSSLNNPPTPQTYTLNYTYPQTPQTEALHWSTLLLIVTSHCHHLGLFSTNFQLEGINYDIKLERVAKSLLPQFMQTAVASLMRLLTLKPSNEMSDVNIFQDITAEREMVKLLLDTAECSLFGLTWILYLVFNSPPLFYPYVNTSALYSNHNLLLNYDNNNVGTFGRGTAGTYNDDKLQTLIKLHPFFTHLPELLWVLQQLCLINHNTITFHTQQTLNTSQLSLNTLHVFLQQLHRHLAYYLASSD